MGMGARLLDADDITGLCNIIAVDPGGSAAGPRSGAGTGWAVFSIQRECYGDEDYGQFRILDNIVFWDCGTLTGEQFDQVEFLCDLAEQWPDAALVCEDFQLRQRHVELSPVEIRAAWSFQMNRVGRPVFRQNAEPMKRMAGGDTHPRLKEWKLWKAASEVPGAPSGSHHHRDATAHAVLFARRAVPASGIARKLRNRAWPFLFENMES